MASFRFRSPCVLDTVYYLFLSSLILQLVLSTDNVERITKRVLENVSLACPLMTGINGTTQLFWKRDDKVIAKMVKVNQKWELSNQMTNNHKVDQADFSLLLTSLGVQDTGTYMCEATLDNSMSLTSQHYVLTVLDVPSKPPVPPVVTAIDAYAITVNWQPSMRDNNSPITGYIVQYKNIDEDKLYQKPVKNVNHTMIDNLWPFIQYVARVIAINEVGESIPSSYSQPVRTHEAAPTGKVHNVQSYGLNSTAIHVEWERPAASTISGILRGYILQHEIASGGTPSARTVMDQNLTAWNFTSLKPYTPYFIKIKIFNNAGDGPDFVVTEWTDEGVPSKPRIIYIPNRSHDSLKIEWERPSQINGNLIGYKIYVTEKRDKTVTKEFDMLSSNRESMKTYIIPSLKPYTEYNIQVSAYTKQGQSEKSDVFPGLTDLKEPGPPGNVTLTHNSSTSLWLEWTQPQFFVKQVNLYYIRYRDSNQRDFTKLQYLPNSTRRRFAEYIEGLQPNTEYEVQIAGATKSMFINRYFTGEFSLPVYIKMPGGITIIAKEQGEQLVTAAVIASVLGVFFLVILVSGILIFMRKYHRARYLNIPERDGQHGLAPPTGAAETHVRVHVQQPYIEQPYVMRNIDDTNSIPVDTFSKHVAALHVDGDLGFAQEYNEIKQNTPSGLTSYYSTEPENKNKNRYSDIKTYDHSRVVLKSIAGVRNSDYINANYVDGYQKQNAYIATQGPLPTTFADFWRMVWEQNSTVIVMITNLTERGRRKCDQYWPNEGEATYGTMVVKSLSTSVMAHYTTRLFSLKHTKVKKKATSERLIYQYHYTNWPDHGVPDFTLPVLSFIRKSAAMSLQHAGPIIVHCSAGVGRTGTYIVLDSMMQQINNKDKPTVNVYGFLSHIRQQRNYLVQTEDQYIFIHDALIEYIESGDSEIPATQLCQHLQDLTVTNGPGSVTLLDKHFKLITALTYHDYEFESALKVYNVSKNRVGGTLPVELSRVPLPAKPGEEGSNYINASYLNGYYRGREYIVTQHPLEKTVEDFWRMVWDQNSMTVVLLSQPENDFIQFWPEKDETMDCGNFNVTFSEESHQLNYNIKYFLLGSTQDDYEYMTRVISSSYWPESCSPLSTVFELISTVKACHAENDEYEGPIIVIDGYCGFEAGSFCALSTLYEQLQQEGSVDAYMVAKLYHMKRPNIFRSNADYHFLVKAIESVSQDVLREKQNSVVSYGQQSHPFPGPRYTSTKSNALTQPVTPSRLGSASQSPQHATAPPLAFSLPPEEQNYLTPAGVDDASPLPLMNGRIPSPVGNISPKHHVSPGHNCHSSSPSQNDLFPQSAVTLQENGACSPEEGATEYLLDDSCVNVSDRSSDNLLNHVGTSLQETVM